MANDKAKKKAAKKVEKAVRKAVKKGLTESAVEKAVLLGMANGVQKKLVGKAAAKADDLKPKLPEHVSFQACSSANSFSRRFDFPSRRPNISADDWRKKGEGAGGGKSPAACKGVGRDAIKMGLRVGSPIPRESNLGSFLGFGSWLRFGLC
jgi:hypothetical protein